MQNTVKNLKDAIRVIDAARMSGRMQADGVYKCAHAMRYLLAQLNESRR